MCVKKLMLQTTDEHIYSEGMMIEKEIQKVVDLRDKQDKTFVEIADILGFSASTAKRRYRAAVLTEVVEELSNDGKFPAVEDMVIPEITGQVPIEGMGLIERFRPLEVEGNAIITSDWHIPLHDPVLINKFLEHAVGNQLIINGDFWHMETFSSYLPYQPEASLEAERYHGNIIMKNLLNTFEHVYMIAGNHDVRIARKLGFKKSFEECMDWMFFALSDDERSRLHVSSLDYLYYYPTWRVKAFRVCHPDNFSVLPLEVPRTLALKYGMSVITGHSHHLAMGIAQDGYNLIMESGGFFAPNRTEYIQSTKKGHQWAQGWIEFSEGVPYLRGPLLNNV